MVGDRVPRQAGAVSRSIATPVSTRDGGECRGVQGSGLGEDLADLGKVVDPRFLPDEVSGRPKQREAIAIAFRGLAGAYSGTK
jgi:hypothetical protein